MEDGADLVVLVGVVSEAQGENILSLIPARDVFARGFCGRELVTLQRRSPQQAEEDTVALPCGLGRQGGEEILSHVSCLIAFLIYPGRMGEEVVPKGGSEAVCRLK